MARFGPAPDPNALRREHDGGAWLDLPAAGRPGDPPVWPLSRASARELALWRQEWARPQALAWARNRQELEVGLYVRTLVEAERPGASAAVRTLVRQQMAALGVTVDGLARNRWRIVADEVAPRRRVGRDDDAERARLRAALPPGPT